MSRQEKSGEPRFRRRWILIGATLLLISGGWWALGAIGGPSVQWIEIERDDLVLSVDVEGKLKAVETTTVGPPQIRDMWQYKIASMAPEGDEVSEGAEVLAFDSSELQQRLQGELAERDAARKRVEQREKEYAVHSRADELALAQAEADLRKARLKIEAPEEMTAARELEQLRLDHELAEKKVEHLKRRLASSARAMEANLGSLRAQARQAEQHVEETQDAIAQMSRKAPIAGTVIYVTDWQDEKKAVGDACWRGESVIELPNLERMMGTGKVHEADAGKVVEDQRVTLRLDAHPDVEFAGRVASIWSTVQRGSRRNPLKVVRLEIDLDETDTQRMRPGMRFRGRVETERVDDALVVDADAVFLRPEGPIVFRKTLFGFEPIAVELGRRSENRVEVISGLDEGDRISAVDLERAGRRG